MAQYNHQQLIADNFERVQLAQKYALAKQLGTTVGFFMYYLDSLCKFNTQTETFNNVNLLHFKIFGSYKYSDYNSFRNTLAKHLKNR